MRLESDLVYKGIFWPPQADNKKTHGVLKISKNGQPTVELIGDAGEFPLTLHQGGREIDRLHGALESGDSVTLDNCSYQYQHFGHLPQSTIRVERVFIGHNYAPEEHIKFYKLIFSVEGLDKWLNLSGLEFPLSNEYKLSIGYTPPEAVSFIPAKGIKGTIKWEWNVIPRNSNSIIAIEEHPYIEIEAEEEADFLQLSEIIFSLNNFFCFALDATVTLTSLSGFSKNIKMTRFDGNQFESPIRIFSQTLPFSDIQPELDPTSFLFGFPVVSKRLDDVFLNWISYFDKAHPVIGLYLASKIDNGAYIERSFLSVVQALEVMQRRKSTKTSMSTEEFETIKSVLMDACPSKRKKWLKGRLKYANEISLRDRLAQLLEPFRDLYGDKKTLDSLLIDVTNARNYLTHYDPKLEDKAPSLIELYHLNQKMEALCQLHLLSVIGFADDEIIDAAKKSHAIRERLST